VTNARVYAWSCICCVLSAHAALLAGDAGGSSESAPARQATTAPAPGDNSQAVSSTRLLMRKVIEAATSPPGGAAGGKVKRPRWQPPWSLPTTRPTTRPAGAVTTGPTTRPAGSQATTRATTRPAGTASGAKGSPTTRPAVAGATTKPAPQGDKTTREVIPAAVLKNLQELPVGDLPRAGQVADRLYRDGNYQVALVFYQRAGKSETDDQTRAWLLFQTANCQRHKDPAAAMATYKKLVQDFPGCSWAPAAEITNKLLQWHQVNQPREFLKQLESKGQQ